MAWTKEQMQCIEPRNGIHNVLVSAGAGAGKTATLVETIIRSITNDSHDMGINEVLCVTFTREAAREMKERIIAAIEGMMRQEPTNVWLKKQLSLTETASIMTIDSFCLRLLKDHISDTDVDPAFRIADQAELSVLKEKVLDSLLEEYYEKGEEEFLSFVDAYSSGKHDKGVRDAIMAVYTMSQSNPFPEEWIMLCKNNLLCNDVEKAEWLCFLMQDIRMQLESVINNLNYALSICHESDGPYIYGDMISSDISLVQRLCASTSYQDLSANLLGMTFMRMSSKKDTKIDAGKKEFVSSIRNSSKKCLQDIQKKFTFKSNSLNENMAKHAPHMLTLLDLALTFMDAFSQAKKEKAVLDFSDIEHIALALLIDKDTKRCTELADHISKGFKRIYVDEYQDVNMLQETIIQNVSTERFACPNIFMVGDVKQSIYKFRLARPELFLEKHAAYDEDEMAQNQKVELSLNFRSRKEVLNTVNFFFSQLMTPSLGNISYDERTALSCGATYPLGVSPKKTTLCLIDTEAIHQDDEYKGRQQEAMVIADTIKAIVGTEAVFDKRTGAYRVANYKDIVVLTRTFTGWAEDIRDILDKEGIPSYADKTVGFFDTVEVQAVLSVLQVADNPLQDIPLSSAMMQVWDFTVIEMSEIAETFKQNAEAKGNLYYALQLYKENGTDESLKVRINGFLSFIERLNVECKDYSIYELLNIIYIETGYYAKATSLPTGEVKKANLEMLLMEAEKFAKTDSSAGGIFRFVKYVDTLRKYEKESGESTYVDKDAVRITTIHKSKGLEFPIVILAGIGKKFNQQDTRKPILVHQDLGLVSDIINPENRTKTLTLAKRAVARRIQIETLEEELRILYVAMTRAKERLVLIGSERDILGRMRKFSSVSACNDVALPYMELTQANSYMDWIFMSLMRNESYESFLSMAGLEMRHHGPVYAMDANIEVKMIDAESLLSNHVVTGKTMLATKAVVLGTIKQKANKKSNIPYANQAVAELKPKALPEDLVDMKISKTVVTEEIVLSKRTPILPKFMQEKVVSGAEKGNIYHRILQVLNFAKCATKADLDNEIQKLILTGIISEKEFKSIETYLIYEFFRSGLGKRMIAASAAGTMKREAYYMESVSASLVNSEIKDDTTVIMQGVIDAYFAEADDFVLVDYKSEHVKAGEEAEAAKRHCSQINRYRKVMEKNGKAVKEAYIVFLQTGVAVAV